MKFKHSVGEKVLCFEPDESKARVLYNAKIMDADAVKDVNGKKLVEYKIHFQGWNHAWDRWAEESFVLKDNEQNRKLQRKLARRAIRKLKLQKGRRRHHLPGVASKPDGEEVEEPESSSDESFDSDITNSTSTGGTRGRFSESDGDEPPDKRVRMNSMSSVGPSTQVISDVFLGEDCSSSKDDNHMRRLLNLDIPLSLQRRLEEDNIMVTRRNMIVDLPICPNVVQILENYTKRFALHSIGAADKQRFTSTAAGQAPGVDVLPPDKRLNLCQEICCDLKLLFDYVLPLSLLYRTERDQFKRLIKEIKIQDDSGQEEKSMSAGSPTPLSHTKPSHAPASPRLSSTTKRLVFEDESLTKVEAPVDVVNVKIEESSSNIISDLRNQTEGSEIPSEKEAQVTSSVLPPEEVNSEGISPSENPDQSKSYHKKKSAEELLIEETHKYIIPNQPNLDQTGLSKDAQGRRRSSRLSHHDFGMSQIPGFSEVNYQPGKSINETFQDRDRMPGRENDSLNTPRNVVSLQPCIFLRALLKHKHAQHNNSGNSEGSPSCSRQPTQFLRQPLFNANPYLNKEQYLSAAGSDMRKVVELTKSWHWCILPDTYQPEEGAHVPPSLIYGIHHLLRLFVKLPDILTRMEIPEFKVKILIKHLNTLLKFLSEYERELFEVDSYITAPTL